MTRIEELKEEIRLLEQVIALRNNMWTSPYTFPYPYIYPQVYPSWPYYPTYVTSGYASTTGANVSNGTITTGGAS